MSMAAQDLWTQRVQDYAGRVAEFVKNTGKASVTQLNLGLKLPTSCLFMGVGWLVKEGRLQITEENNVLFFALKPAPKKDGRKAKESAASTEALEQAARDVKLAELDILKQSVNDLKKRA